MTLGFRLHFCKVLTLCSVKSEFYNRLSVLMVGKMLSRAEVLFIERIFIYIKRTNQSPDNWMEMTNEHAELRGVKCWHKQSGISSILILCVPLLWNGNGLGSSTH